MLGKAKVTKLGGKAEPVAAAPKSLKFNGETARPAKIKPVKDDDPEKPHKGSLKKAKRKAEALRSELAETTEADLIAAMPAATAQEREHLEEYLHMFGRLRKLIRKAERTCLTVGSNSREYYALCALYSQQREIIADIRSVSDMSGQVATMDTNVIRPLVSAVGQNILDSMFQIRKVLIDCSRKEDTQDALHRLEGITNEQGKFLHAQYGTATEKVSSILLG